MKNHEQAICVLVFAAALLGGCAKPVLAPKNPPPAPPASAVLSESAAPDSAVAKNPHIDCPLRKQGINPDMMRPFENTEKYIRFLERPDRALWQKPDEVIRELHLTGNEKIADIGAGSGYFTFRFARTAPIGKVYAIDIEPEMLRHIHHKAMMEGASNIEVIRADFDDPHVPADADLIFMCDVIHHVADKKTWLAKVSSQMRTGARLVVVEFKEGNLPEGPPEKIKIPKSRLISMITEEKFILNVDKSNMLPYQTFLLFFKAQ
jgi:SAM-dependent methyltransferase